MRQVQIQIGSQAIKLPSNENVQSSRVEKRENLHVQIQQYEKSVPAGSPHNIIILYKNAPKKHIDEMRVITSKLNHDPGNCCISVHFKIIMNLGIRIQDPSMIH